MDRRQASEWLAHDNDDNLNRIKRFFLKSSSSGNTPPPLSPPPVGVDNYRDSFLFIEELAEETKERRGKAFKKYEEYCEKRKFRILSPRSCPAIDKCKCGGC